jgi:hypothetical protein
MTYISSKRILPVGPVGAKVLIINDFPGDQAPLTEDAFRTLQKAYPGDITQCRIASLSEYAPANRDFNYLDGSPELERSLKNLYDYISTHPPEIIITLGEKPLNYLAKEYNINNWRGSPLRFRGIKLLPTLSPSIFGTFTMLQFDIQKALDYSRDLERIYNDNFSIITDPVEQRNYFDEILAAEYVTIDIETRRNESIDLLCVGFGLSSERGICFVTNSFSAIQNVRELIPQIKNPIYHNGLFDLTVLRNFHDILASPLVFDTLIAQHCLEPELPKDLGFLCSTLTWRPCYWGSVKFDDEKTHSQKRNLQDLYVYNCKDVCVTYEAFEKLSVDINESANLKRIFDFECSALEASIHITTAGFFVDEERRNLLRDTITARWKVDYATLCLLAGKNVLVSSPKQVKEFLYTDLGLPIRRDRDGSVTTGEDALVGLIGYCNGELSKVRTDESRMKWRSKIAILKLILNIREYDKLLSSYINVGVSNDGRLRGILKVAGTESGRWSGGNYYDGTGLNVQTLPRRVIKE